MVSARPSLRISVCPTIDHTMAASAQRRVSRVRQLDANALDAVFHGLLRSGVVTSLGLFKVRGGGVSAASFFFWGGGGRVFACFNFPRPSPHRPAPLNCAGVHSGAVLTGD